MATAADICNQAGLLARILGEGETYAGDALTFAFTRLQRIVGELMESNYLEIPVPAATTTVIDISPGSLGALEYNLAVELANQTGRAPDPVLIGKAGKSLTLLKSRSTLNIGIDYNAGGLGVSRGYNINSDA